MDFIILLIIGLGIIFTTWKCKIEKKGGLLYFFLIYLAFLLNSGYHELMYSKDFNYSQSNMYNIFDTLDVNLLGAYFYFYGIFYVILFSIYFIFLDKKLNLLKKIYLFIRDFIILFSVFLFFWGYNDVVGKYQYYYDWYKNSDNFGGEEFICMDNSARLLLERNYRHGVIVNPYNNFYEFYKNFGEKKNFGEVLTNKLPETLVIKNYLSTCKNSKGENYYKKYNDIHGSEPYYKSPEYHSYLKYDFILSKQEVLEILEKLNLRENYVDNLLEYEYSEIKLDISFDDLNNDDEKLKIIEKEIDILRKNKFPQYTQWVRQELYSKIPYFDAGWPCGKRGEGCPGGKFGISEQILKKAIGERWSRFYKDQEGNMYITTLKSLYINNQQVYENILMHGETSGPIKNLSKINHKLTFEYQYLDLEHNIQYQSNYCDSTLMYGKGRYDDCHLEYIPEERKSIPKCENEKKLSGFTQYAKCSEYKYDYENMKNNIYFDGKDINKIYNLDGSKNIFSFKNKVGFVGSNNLNLFIMYDGKQISENFTYIKTQTCCASFRYKFNIYENGVLEYIFVRDKKVYIGFIQLK